MYSVVPLNLRDEYFNAVTFKTLFIDCVSKFACVNFQTNMTSFLLNSIAIYFGVHFFLDIVSIARVPLFSKAALGNHGTDLNQTLPHVRQ